MAVDIEAARAEALRRSPRLGRRAGELIDACEEMIAKATAYSREHFADLPEVSDWVWTE